MNVIFLDFDGVIDTVHHNSNEDIERKIKILSKICNEFNCKIVIEAAIKDIIDEKTLKTDNEWVNYIFGLFNKYGIDCIGRTPNVIRRINSFLELPMWKEDEIISYLSRHPEIEHFCIIDDDDLSPRNSDLNKVRDYLLKTIDYSNNPDEEGLLESHKEEIGKILCKENKFKTI